VWLDRGIGWLFPGWGLSRLRSRAALQVIGQVARSYEGAKRTRRTSNWVAGGNAANAEIAPAINTLRNRSRDLVRNNPYARRAVAKLVSASIGTGIMARPEAAVAKVWKKWCAEADYEGQLNFYGLQAMIGRTVFESGECLVRRMREGSGYSGSVPLKLQVLEPDYIDSTRVGPTDNGNYIIAGIEIDPGGRRVAYWLWDQHPGELVTFPMQLRSRRVDAAEIIHVYEKERPGQLRGVPRLAVSMIKLRDLDDYEEAELVRKKIEACFAAFVTSPETSRPIAEAATTTDSATGKVTRTETVSPGMIEYLKPGEEVNFGSPNSALGYADYTASQLHAIAAGAGVTYEQLTGDFSRVNYSSMRGGTLEFRELVELWRWMYFIPMVCEPIFKWWVEAAYVAGKVRTNDYDVIWTAPKFEWVDPLKDVQGEKLETISGFKTLSAILRERGEDPDEVFAEYKKERETLKQMGLTFDASAITAKAVDSASTDGTDPAEGSDGTPAGDTKPGQNTKDDAAKRELHLHVSTPVTIAEGAVRVDVAPGKGDTHLHLPATAPAPSERTVVFHEDDKGEITGATVKGG
jgi:lambda family phage portal protein